MVRMITLRKRAGHEIAAFDATRPSSITPCPPRTPLLHNNLSTITSTGGYAFRHGWEKCLTPKKNHPPTCKVHHPRQCQQLKPLRSPPPTKNFQNCRRSSIKWLYLHHCFLQAYFARHKPTTEPNEPSSSWLGMSPTCRRHVGLTAKRWHFWPTQPCLADTKLIPTPQHFCVWDDQHLPPSSFSTRGTYAQPAKNLYIRSSSCLSYNRCSK
jgi:hypothetical protein